jgi:putative transposon-encoded protein
MQRTLIAVALAAMLTVAGCAGPGLSGGPSDGTSTDAADGVVNMYVSDQPGAMDDFEHLNVTVTKVALHKANATEDGETAMNGTETESDSDDEEGEDAEEFDPDGDGWVVKEIDDRRVDLSQLQGQNASRLGSLPVENGTYDKVFVFVEDANGTLTSGETTNVKIPSGRLQINEEFTVGNGEEVDFVFDMTVVKAGNSGKYVLQPVVSESGTDVPFQTRDADGEGLDARFEGRVTPGEEATVVVTRQGQPVEGATVEAGDGEYTTDADGTVSFRVPEDAEELEVEIEDGDDETEIERKFPGAEDAGPPEDGEDADEQESEEADDEADDDNGQDDERSDAAAALLALLPF